MFSNVVLVAQESSVCPQLPREVLARVIICTKFVNRKNSNKDDDNNMWSDYQINTNENSEPHVAISSMLSDNIDSAKIYCAH